MPVVPWERCRPVPRRSAPPMELPPEPEPMPEPEPEVFDAGNDGMVEPPRIKAIKREICAKHGVKMRDLSSSCRSRPLILARWEVMARLHAIGLPLARIGQALNRDHTTVLHGIRQNAKSEASCAQPQ